MTRTRLYDRHVALNGRIVDYAGWELPVQYPTGPKAEHLAVRSHAGLFDIDHMAQLTVEGPDALAFLQYALTADISGIPLWGAGYALMCYADGGIVDDTFVYHLPGSYFVAINASNSRKDTRWMQALAVDFDVEVENVSQETYMLALQGPTAEAILQQTTADDLAAISFHTCARVTVAGVPALVSRTGYTGEDGFELYFEANDAPTIWDAIMVAGEPYGLLPIGLAARDSLRFEACMPLYGQELGPDISPLEARMGWAIAWNKGAFVGREALLKQRLEGIIRRLVAFKMVDRGVARHGYDILSDGEVVGEVSSAMYAPSLDGFFGMGFVPVSLSKIGTEIAIRIRGKARRAIIVKRPFYIPAYRR